MAGKVHEWLDQLGLGQYSAAFSEQGIDWDVLPDLDHEALKAAGVARAGDRIRLMRAARALAVDSVEPSAHPPATAALPADGIPRSPERRQLTVMFCDLVGSTTLARELDPEALRDVMQAYQRACSSVIERYDGHVAQYLGDGLMSYFGWPRAYEDAAERAIRAALEIVEVVKQVQAPSPLEVRIGIATGEVVVGETGAGDASVPKLAVGETPNLAARLQGLAAEDQILISPDTRRLVGGIFELADLGEHALRGITNPVHAWRVTGLAAERARFDAAHGQALSPLVGRELELGMLIDRWTRSREGGGQVVLLGGEPGVGKSRILRALREQLARSGVASMRFQCSPYHVNSAYWPSIDAIERTLGFGREEPPESKLDKLESLMVGHYSRPLSDVRFIASMLSIPFEARYGEAAMTPQKFKDETLRVLVDMSEAAARRQPSVMLFEDVHWADPTMLEVLDLLVDRIRSMPLLAVFTHRPEFENRWAGRDDVTSLSLSKLTRTQSGALVSQIAGGRALPDALFEQILTRTDGIPLFVEELTKSILESGALSEVEDRYEYTGAGHTVSIPATLRDSLMARLDRVVSVKEIAQIGAVIGREFSYELIGAVASMPAARLDDALARLTDSGLASRRGTPPEATYAFKHALVRDAAYDSLLKSRRQVLHGRIAATIEQRFPQTLATEPEVLAQHLTAAGETAAAIPLWQRAGELALGRTTLAEAVAHLNQGLSLLQTLPESVERDVRELELRFPLGMAWMSLRGWATPEVWDTLEPASILAKRLNRQDLLSPIEVTLQGNLLTRGRVAESLKWAWEILETAVSAEDKDGVVSAHAALATTCFCLGRFSESLEHSGAGLELFDDESLDQDIRPFRNDTVYLHAYAAVSNWMLGYPDQSVVHWKNAVATARRGGNPFMLGWALTHPAIVLALRGETQLFLRCAEECERIGRNNSLPILWTMQAPIRYGIAHIYEGKAHEGIGLVGSGLEVWQSIGGRLDLPFGKSTWAEGLAKTGDIAGALRHLDEAIEQVERPGWEERYFYAEILRLKGWVLSLTGDLAAAESNYLASLDVARAQQARSLELRTAISLARLWRGQGRSNEALGLLRPVYDWFTEGFETRDLKEAEALLTELGA